MKQKRHLFLIAFVLITISRSTRPLSPSEEQQKRENANLVYRFDHENAKREIIKNHFIDLQSSFNFYPTPEPFDFPFEKNVLIQAAAFNKNETRIVLVPPKSLIAYEFRLFRDHFGNYYWKKTDLKGHDAPINAVAINHKNGIIATASDDRTIRLWENKSIKKILRGHTDKVYSVAFSHDGNQIVSTSADGSLRIWSQKENGKWDSQQIETDNTSFWSAHFNYDDTSIISEKNGKTKESWQQLDLVGSTNVSNKIMFLQTLDQEGRFALQKPDLKAIFETFDDSAKKYLQKKYSIPSKYITTKNLIYLSATPFVLYGAYKFLNWVLEK